MCKKKQVFRRKTCIYREKAVTLCPKKTNYDRLYQRHTFRIDAHARDRRSRGSVPMLLYSNPIPKTPTRSVLRLPLYRGYIILTKAMPFLNRSISYIRMKIMRLSVPGLLMDFLCMITLFCKGIR